MLAERSYSNCLNHSINCRGKLLTLHEPVVMGILNVTPDSFYDGGKFIEETAILKRAGQIVDEGAAIIDIGAISSRPGSQPISTEEELSRLLPAVRLVARHFPEIFISIDTFRATVAQAVFEEGAHIINDITGGEEDPEIVEVAIKNKAPIVIMHMQGRPSYMQDKPGYSNVITEVFQWLQKRIHALRQQGLKDIIADPGFGFGKTVEHNFALLNNLELFQYLDVPLLAGLSRKSMISKSLGINTGESLNGTAVLNTLALTKGVSILRVHDVREAVQAIRLLQQTIK